MTDKKTLWDYIIADADIEKTLIDDILGRRGEDKAKGALRRAGITTINDTLNLSIDELDMIRGIDTKSIDYIKSELEIYFSRNFSYVVAKKQEVIPFTIIEEIFDSLGKHRHDNPDRRIFMMYYGYHEGQGIAIADIANQKNMTTNAVEDMLSKCREIIKKNADNAIRLLQQFIDKELEKVTQIDISHADNHFFGLLTYSQRSFLLRLIADLNPDRYQITESALRNSTIKVRTNVP